MDAQARYQHWLADPLLTEQERQELQLIEGNREEIERRFHGELEFGTAGLRGVLAAGSGCMNVYNVKRATQGLADCLLQTGKKAKGVAIAYDSRHMSKEFADEAAQVLCANGIEVFLFDALRPVPELSFAVRHLGCGAGISITASHNPAKYNGYKVYAAYGGQLSPEASAMVYENMQKIQCMADVKSMEKDAAVAQGLLHIIGKEVDEAYYQGLLSERLHPDAPQKAPIGIAYTPLSGAGYVPVTEVLRRAGYGRVCVVEREKRPDGNFPTVPSPNPENEQALTLAYELGYETGADIVLGTDPDSDRMACAVSDGKQFFKLSGNQTGVLLLHYILESLAEQGRLRPDGLVCKSFVSTRLADRVAQRYGLKMENLLTGFRFIAELVEEQMAKGRPFYFGFEESCGYLTGGNLSRDKDAVLACLLISEAAAYYKEKGKTLLDVLNGIYAEHGYFIEKTQSIPFEGMDGKQQMERWMDGLRSQPPKSFGGLKVESLSDYQSGIKTLAGGAMENIDLPSSNVLIFDLEGGSWICMRPSGTEPILKVYLAACAAEREACEETFGKLSESVREMMG